MKTSAKKFVLPKNSHRMSVDMDEQLHKKIKVASAKNRVTMRVFITEILKAHFREKKTCEN